MAMDNMNNMPMGADNDEPDPDDAPGYGSGGGGGGLGELPVPLAALAQPDDAEKMQTPAAGDTVSLQVDATVTRIEGELAYVRPTAVNGNPLDEEAGENPEAADEREGTELRAMALNA